MRSRRRCWSRAPSGFPVGGTNLGAAETLALLNRFFSWVADEPIERSDGIVADCGRGQLTVVFSTAFADAEPFDEALWVARQIAEEDLDFSPRIGLACGQLIIGYVGSRLDYRCAAVGHPVDLAEGCAGFGPPPGSPGAGEAYIAFPQEDWEGRDPEVVFAPRRLRVPDGSEDVWRFPWRLLHAAELDLPESGPLLVRRAVACLPGADAHTATAEEQIRAAVAHIRRSGK